MRRAFRDGLRWVEADSRERFNADFLDAGEERQIELLTEMPESSEGERSEGHSFFLDIRARTVFAYYTSKIGIHDELEYKGKTAQAEWTGCPHPEHHDVEGEAAPPAIGSEA